MEPISIVIALVVILLPMLTTGFIISKFVVNECPLMERFGFTMAFGSCFIYFIYLGLKNNFHALDLWLIFGVLSGIIVIYMLRYGYGKRFFGWLFASKHE